MTQAQKIQCFLETTEWLKGHIDAMKLEEKKVFVILGASRTGKGTLLTALHGGKMKLFKRAKIKDEALREKVATTQQTFMAPVGDDGEPKITQFISFSHNSHTLKPKFVKDPPEWHEKYMGLDGWHGIDFPGMFESRGPEIEQAIMLALQYIFQQAKESKVLVLVSANIFLPESNEMIKTISDKLNYMFKNPAQNTLIGIVKTGFEKNTLGEPDEILNTACGIVEEGDEPISRSFKEWHKPFPEQPNRSHIMIVEQDNEE